MRSCTTRWAPSAGSPQRRVHEEGSSARGLSYTALGPKLAREERARKREKYRKPRSCATLPLG
jgi:hypothetical protein